VISVNCDRTERERALRTVMKMKINSQARVIVSNDMFAGIAPDSAEVGPARRGISAETCPSSIGNRCQLKRGTRYSR